LLREIIKSLARTGTTTAITASTGIAAVNIGGVTLHSWAGTFQETLLIPRTESALLGIGLGKEKVDVLIRNVCA